jgi:uncharacterized protein
VGTTPLVQAIIYRKPSLALFFLKKGARIDLSAGAGRMPLHFAAQEGMCDVITALLDKGQSPNIRATMGEVPLEAAAYRGDMAPIKLLIARGAEVNAKCTNDGNILQHTTSREIAAFFLSRGADVNSRDNLGDTPLHKAAEDGAVEVVGLFLAKGAEANARNKVGSTPLHEAAWRSSSNKKGVFVLLLAAKAEVDPRDEEGRTPLYLAVDNPFTTAEDIEVLLKAGANPLAVTRDGKSPVSLAAEQEAQRKELLPTLKKYAEKSRNRP